MPSKAASTSLSDREMQLLHNYLRCMKTKPEIDMEKFAAMSGFGGVPSARANIGRLLAKISSEQETSGSASPTKNGDGDDAVPAIPASKKKSAGRKRKTDTAATDDAEDESPSKKKVSPTKRKGKAAADAADPDEEVLVKSEAE